MVGMDMLHVWKGCEGDWLGCVTIWASRNGRVVGVGDCSKTVVGRWFSDKLITLNRTSRMGKCHHHWQWSVEGSIFVHDQWGQLRGVSFCDVKLFGQIFFDFLGIRTYDKTATRLYLPIRSGRLHEWFLFINALRAFSKRSLVLRFKGPRDHSGAVKNPVLARPARPSYPRSPDFPCDGFLRRPG